MTSLTLPTSPVSSLTLMPCGGACQLPVASDAPVLILSDEAAPAFPRSLPCLEPNEGRGKRSAALLLTNLHLPLLLISRCSQILAVRQSRSTVGVETPSTSAVSLMVSPPK